MNKYDVICMIGEGSFGRVYKARTKEKKEIVALKLITKYGRSVKELTSLRSECEIQQHLNHPNIIDMLDSFETENEIVVVTEFAYQDLYDILAKEGYLNEDRASNIIFDLISALYYLHSNRVLHRDLKPQNVLLTEYGVAKLCDFGFARNMSLSTHVLTSIKGTPLYMAPEIMEESTYDHTADLWSLGCIAYEILVGTPPFTTTSILHLVHMIRYESIRWPEFISDKCQSLLKGLLNKDPAQRLKWPQLLEHPFVKGNILITDDKAVPTPLTAELTSSQAKAKELQKQDLAANKATKNMKNAAKLNRQGSSNIVFTQFPLNNVNLNLEETEKQMSKLAIAKKHEIHLKLEDELKEALNYGNSESESQLEPEEWLVFLQKSMEEIMEGDIQSIKDPAFLNMVCRALSSNNANVIEYIASLFCLPFTIELLPESDLTNLRKVYFDVKLVPKLVYACLLITRRANQCTSITADQLQALELIYLLITNLVHVDIMFLKQFCTTCISLSLSSHFVFILGLKKRKVRLATNIISILCHILRELPDYSDIVMDVVKGFESPDIEFQSMLTMSTECLSARTLALIKLMLKVCPETLNLLCSESIEKDLESLTKSSKESLTMLANDVLQELKNFNRSEQAAIFIGAS